MSVSLATRCGPVTHLMTRFTVMSSLTTSLLIAITLTVTMSKPACGLRQDIKAPFEDLICSDADCYRDSRALIESRGFKCESHYLTTGDGYILHLFHIVNPFNTRQTRKPHPVLLMDTALTSSDQWMLHPKGDAREPRTPTLRTSPGDVESNNVAFELSNFGFDVWLANGRGSVYSINHTNVSPKSSTFWKFSLDERVLDHQLHIDYVLSITSSTSLAIVGFSDAATSLLWFLSTTNKYDRVLKPVVLLAGTMYYSNTRQPTRKVLYETLRATPGPIFQRNLLQTAVFAVLCNQFTSETLCGLIFATTASSSFNKTRAPVFMQHVPAGTSNWVLSHELQFIDNGTSRRFDYGTPGNLEHYGQATPPVFDINAIASPYLAFFHGESDKTTRQSDTVRTINQLKENGVRIFLNFTMTRSSWIHNDFQFADDLGRLLIPKLVRTLVRASRAQI